jgi:23S rRNA (pseudouridine1915-N3)-methyltransferase
MAARILPVDNNRSAPAGTDRVMRIGLFAVGRLKAGPEKDLAGRYLDRFAKAGPAVGLELARVVETVESRAGNAETRKREEAGQLEKALAEGSLLVLLDERGKALDSEAFAHLLATFRDSGKRDLMIAIGGADGLDPALHARADAVLNLGRMTWPHQLVRILIAEQLSRSVTILSGHPYHRA